MSQNTPAGELVVTETPIGPFLMGRLKDESLGLGSFVLSSQKVHEPEPVWELRLVPLSRTRSWCLNDPIIVRVHPNSVHYPLCEERRVLTSPSIQYPEIHTAVARSYGWGSDSYHQGLLIGAISCQHVLQALQPCFIGFEVDGILEQHLLPYVPLPDTPIEDAAWAFYHGFQLALIAFRLLPEGELFGKHSQEFERLVMSVLK